MKINRRVEFITLKSMMKFLYILSFVVLLYTNSYSQKLYSGLEVGIGSYDMTDLKYFNNQVLINLPFEAKVTENFPMYLYYKGFFKYYFTKTIGLGFNLALHSTSSRISRSDYSGDFTYDNIVYCLSPGVSFDCKLLSISNFKIFIYNELGMEFSRLKIINEFRIFDQIQTSSESLNSYNMYSELGLHFSYFYKYFIISLNSGLSLDIGNKGIPLIQWTGFREGITISYRID
jgi:hypothetical protein